MSCSNEQPCWERPVLKKGEIKDETHGGTGSAATDADFVTS